MRNFECEKYTECLGYAAKKNLSFQCGNCKDMSNFLKPEKVKQVVDHVEKGESIRKTSRETGVAKNTVKSIQRIVVAEKINLGEPILLCKCGQPAGHKGWCSHRLAESPKRQKFLMKQWGKLTFDDIAKKQFDSLEQKRNEIEIEIKKLMAEITRINCRILGLEEYFSCTDKVDDETDEEMANQYIEIICDKWSERKSEEIK